MSGPKTKAAYLQIADHLRSQIVNGTLPPGAPLPTEQELMTRYGAARGTVRHGLDVLKLEGLVHALPRRGVFVAPQTPRRRLANTRHSRAFREQAGSRGAWDAEAREAGSVPRSELVEFGAVVPPPAVVERLQLADGEQALIRRREMFLDDQPAQLATSYLPWSIVQGTPLEQRDSGPGGIYSRLEDLGHQLARFTEDVIARRPSPDEQTFLRIDATQPIFELHRTAYDQEDRPVEICNTVVSTTRYVLSYQWPA